MAQHIVIVCGYGCHLTPELREYLDRVVRFCNEQRPDCLILCGGFTNLKTAPNRSEAQLMKENIISFLEYTPELVYNEDDSYTTLDNIKNAAQMMHSDGLLQENTKLTIFCEATRTLKVDLLARHFIGRRATIETASWESKPPFKQIISVLYDWAATGFNPLARFSRGIRLMLSNIR